MTGIAGRGNLNNPVRRSGTPPVCQLIGGADHADIWFHHVFVIFGKQLYSEGGRVDFTGAFLGINIVCNFFKQKSKYFLVYSAGSRHVIDLAVYQFGSDVLRQVVIILLCVNVCVG